MQRLAAEVVFLAERADITEEITRIASHLAQFQHSMEGDRPGDEAGLSGPGVAQEFNTIGAKSTDAHITGLVVEAKTVVNKVRNRCRISVKVAPGTKGRVIP